MKGAFSIKAKKTPYQRHKELEEEKKRKAEEEAAKVYEEFVESFAADDREDGHGVKAFVRGGTVAPGSRSTDAVGSKGTKYVPSYVPPALASSAAKRPEPGRVHKRHDAFADDDEEDESVFKLPTKKPEKDKPRQIDRMLEELKREQEEREERERLLKEGKPLPPELQRHDDDYASDRGGRGGGRWGDADFLPGSHDEGDPYTTNLYVGNIHPEVNEAHLAREFGRFGPIGSVKIMWPRDEEQRRRGRNCGFVAFMNRPDAEKALKALDGLVLNGMEMKIGWGKAVPLPPVPLYSGHGAVTGPLTAIVPPAVTRDKGNPLTLAMQSALMPAQGMFAKESTMNRTVVKGVGKDIEVKIPGDAKVRFIIDSMALYVLKDGCEFEQLIMMEHQGNPDFDFLFDLDSDEHAYYRWRLYSLAEGDTLRTWRIDAYLMVEGGQAWLPPPMLAADITASTKRKEATRGQTVVLLSDQERDEFEDMLRGLTAERSAIAEAMLFALDNADAAADVVEVLEEALTLPETPPATKLARLFLVNDILHNSTAPVRNASRYRARLEAVLPEIFVSFKETYKAADSRMIQEALKRAVLRLLRVWRERFIFNDDYINGLQATMLGHIPTLEAAEEEELLQQQQAAAEAAAAATAANQTGSPEPEAPKVKSRWEDDEDEQQQRQQRDTEQPAQQRQQPARDSGPTRAQLREFNPELLSELDKLTDEELERRCRVNGLSNKGSRQLCTDRILALDYYLNAEHRSAGGLGSVSIARGASLSNASKWGAPGSTAAAGSSKWESAAPALASADDHDGGGSRWGGRISLNLKTEQVETAAAADALGLGLYSDEELQMQAAVAVKHEPAAPAVAPAAAANRWQAVDEDAEQAAQPQIPISKWLLEEAEAKQKAEEEAAAAAAAAREAAAAAAAREAAARNAMAAVSGAALDSSAARTPDVGAAAVRTPDAAADEERRKRLRQIEVQVLDRQDELQEQGMTESEAAAKAAALRQQLLAKLEADLTAEAAAAKDANEQQQHQQSRADAIGGRERTSISRADRGGQDRDKEKDRGKERDRDRDRERDKDRDSRGGRSERKRSRSRSRSKGRSCRGDDKSSGKPELRRASQSDKQEPSGSRKHSTSSRDRDKDKDRDKDRDREKERSKRSRARSSSRSRSRDKSRDRSRSRSVERKLLRRGGGGRSRSRSRDRDRDSKDRRSAGSSKRHRSR